MANFLNRLERRGSAILSSTEGLGSEEKRRRAVTFQSPGSTARPPAVPHQAGTAWRAAAAQWAGASAQARSLVSAYTAGINAWQAGAMKARPPEFVVLGLHPEPWTPEDSMAWAIMMAWDLGGNWTTELLRMRLALKLPVDRINELLPPYPGEKPPATADYAALFRDWRVDSGLGQQPLAVAPESRADGIGSNNWV